jgi:lycopene beta-cyclase
LKKYDIIITGAGAAGLSFAYKLAKDSFFDEKKILVLDKEEKSAYDKTWCFWSKENNIFPEIILKKWNKLLIRTSHKSQIFDINPYSYNLIKSSDFYRYVLKTLHSKKNFHFKTEKIEEIRTHGSVVTNKSIYHGEYIFNSIGNTIIKEKEKVITLLQHFKGWEIQMERPVFNPEVATLMDFDIDQKGDCRFVYVLPYDEFTAMVEYTVFSENLFDRKEYNAELENYLNTKYNNQPYKILHEEFGVIPMSDFKYTSDVKNSIINIGTLGGATKASTGYTFYFIQMQIDHYIKQLKKSKIKKAFMPKFKYRLYDSVLLHVLKEKKVPAYTIFEDLFFKSEIKLVLKFLSENTNILEDIIVMSKVNIPVFSRAMIRRFRELD